MKSELINNTPEVPAFPALYKSTDNKCVILFSSITEGVVVQSNTPTFKIGEQNAEWFSCFDIYEWARLPSGSQVILTQE
jgi:hypothetical protein